MSQEETAEQYFIKGKTDYQNGNYSDSIRSLLYAQQIYDALQDRESSGECLVALGNVYTKMDQKEKAAQYYVEAMSRYKEAGNNKKLGHCALAIGIIYKDILQSIPKSKEFLKEAITAFSKINDFEKMGDAWKALANSRQSNPKQFLENQDEIHENFITAIDLYKKGKSDEKLAKAELELAQFLMAQTNYKEAEKHLKIAYNFFHENKRYNTLLTVRINLIRVYLELGKKDLARKQYEQAVDQLSLVGCTSDKLERLKALFD